MSNLTIKLMSISFCATHLPLVALLVYNMFSGFQSMVPVMIVLASTLLSAAVSFYLIWKLTRQPG